jgi:cysteine dioxygenase
MGSKLAIDDWVKELVAMPAREFTLERVQGFLRQHAIEPATLEPYLFFSKGNYTRNLIFKNDLFETMTICWDIGQVSRIHNHRDQNCWMAVPIGRLRVQNFRVEIRDAAHSTCRLVATDAFDMEPDHPAAVNPVEPVHQVLNLAEFNRRAVSIHVYSRPFASCEVYLPDKGTYFDAPLHYTSEYGRLCAEEKLL